MNRSASSTKSGARRAALGDMARDDETAALSIMNRSSPLTTHSSAFMLRCISGGDLMSATG